MRYGLLAFCVAASACTSPQGVEQDLAAPVDVPADVSSVADLGAPDVRVPDALPEVQPDLSPELLDVGPEVAPDLPGELGPEAGELPAAEVIGICGDGECLGGEYCDTCPEDCGECTVCGNGECEAGQPLENPETCAVDCGGCGDGICSINELEEDGFCHSDCGYACGDGVCNATEQAFDEEDADYCPVDCGGCYDGVCGYQDLTNPELADCMMADCSTLCGNGICASGETWEECPVDCPVCGDGVCGKVGKGWEDCPLDCDKPCGDGLCESGEDAVGCPADCGPCGDGICSIAEAKYGGCVADCPDTCGNNHCDGIENEETCPSDCACKPECNPAWECGDDDNGCGQPCGICPAGSVCQDHLCCVPDCKQKECGDDGCGGSCGECGEAALAVCVNYSCECTPDCGSKECGDDGCLGSCGKCDDGLFCTLDSCVTGACEFSPQAGHCLVDLLGGAACAEPGAMSPFNPCAVCDPEVSTVDWSPLPDGSPCGAGMFCFGGACCNHAANCMGRVCGSDGCGGLCGECAVGFNCFVGTCVEDSCTPDCTGKECGDNGCQGSCGSCEDGLFCTADSCDAGNCLFEVDAGFCVVEVSEAGNQVSACAPDGAENPENPCEFCSPGLAADDWSPHPDGVVCGASYVCDGGTCIEYVCHAECVGKSCGDDGCGGSCGTCGGGHVCEDGTCVDGCVDDCGPEGAKLCNGNSVVTCGDFDGDSCLDWSAGQACPVGKICIGGACVEGCTPLCGGKECGDDGCGGTCGACGVGMLCAVDTCSVDTECDTFIACSVACEGDNACGTGCWLAASQAAKNTYMAFTNCMLLNCGDPPDPLCASGVITGACVTEWATCTGCVPACDGKECGDSGCLVACGECPAGKTCEGNTCVPCVPDCAGKGCGDDGCGGSCGECGFGQQCIIDQCQDGIPCDDNGVDWDGCTNSFVSEYQVNTFLANDQTDAAVATFDDGGFVVAWETDGSEGQGYEVAFRVFDSVGLPDTGEIVVDFDAVSGMQSDPSVASFANGFVIVWESHFSSPDGYFARVFGKDGQATSPTFQLDEGLTGNFKHSAVAAVSGGKFMPVYANQDDGGGSLEYDLYARGVDEAQVLASQFIVNVHKDDIQWSPSVALFPDESFAIAYESLQTSADPADGQDGSDGGIFFRSYDGDGTQYSVVDRSIHANTAGRQWAPDIAPVGPDTVAAVWLTEHEGGFFDDVAGRIVNKYGMAMSEEFVIGGVQDGHNLGPTVAGRPDGSFVVVWEHGMGSANDYWWDVVGQRFDIEHQPLGEMFLVNTYRPDYQRYPDVALFGDGGFVVAWHSCEEEGAADETSQDGSGCGIFVMRFNADGSLCPVPTCTAG